MTFCRVFMRNGELALCFPGRYIDRCVFVRKKVCWWKLGNVFASKINGGQRAARFNFSDLFFIVRISLLRTRRWKPRTVNLQNHFRFVVSWHLSVLLQFLHGFKDLLAPTSSWAHVSLHERSEAPVHWFLFELLNPAVCQRCGVFGLSWQVVVKHLSVDVTPASKEVLGLMMN